MQDYQFAPSPNVDAISDRYDPTATYAVGDYCIKDDRLYKCSTEISTAEAWNSAHWTETDVASEITSLSNNITNRFTWRNYLSASNVSVGNTYASTGKSFTLIYPAIVQVGMSYGSGRPLAIGIKSSESAGSSSVALCSVVASDIADTSGLTVTAILPAGTYYIWARTASASGSTTLTVNGMTIGAL